MRFVAFVALVLLGLSLAGMAICEEAVAPLAVANKSIGGGAFNEYTPGVEGGTGLNNIGLLIKSWGRVTYVDAAAKCFYINDGSGRKDGSVHLEGSEVVENVGVRVSYDNLAAGNEIVAPAVGQYVAVTCISSTLLVNEKIQPNLRPRRQSDIQPVSQQP